MLFLVLVSGSIIINSVSVSARVNFSVSLSVLTRYLISKCDYPTFGSFADERRALRVRHHQEITALHLDKSSVCARVGVPHAHS